MWGNLDLGNLDFTKIGSQLGEAIQTVKTAAERTVDTALGIDPSVAGQQSSTSPAVNDAAWGQDTSTRGIVSREPSFAFEEPNYDAANAGVASQQQSRPQRRTPGSVQPVLKPTAAKSLNVGREKGFSQSNNLTEDGSAPETTTSTQYHHHHTNSDRTQPDSASLSPEAVFESKNTQRASNSYHTAKIPSTRHHAEPHVTGQLPSQPTQGVEADRKAGPAAAEVKQGAPATSKKLVGATRGKARLGAVRKVVHDTTNERAQQADDTPGGQTLQPLRPAAVGPTVEPAAAGPLAGPATAVRATGPAPAGPTAGPAAEPAAAAPAAAEPAAGGPAGTQQMAHTLEPGTQAAAVPTAGQGTEADAGAAGSNVTMGDHMLQPAAGADTMAAAVEVSAAAADVHSSAPSATSTTVPPTPDTASGAAVSGLEPGPNSSPSANGAPITIDADAGSEEHATTTSMTIGPPLTRTPTDAAGTGVQHDATTSSAVPSTTSIPNTATGDDFAATVAATAALVAESSSIPVRERVSPEQHAAAGTSPAAGGKGGNMMSSAAGGNPVAAEADVSDMAGGADSVTGEEDVAIMTAVEQVIEECSPEDLGAQPGPDIRGTDYGDSEGERGGESIQSGLGKDQATLRHAEGTQHEEDSTYTSTTQPEEAVTDADVADAAGSADHHLAGALDERELTGVDNVAGVLESREQTGVDEIVGVLERREQTGVDDTVGVLEMREQTGADNAAGLLETREQTGAASAVGDGVEPSASGLELDEEVGDILGSWKHRGPQHLTGLEHTQLIQLVERMREENERLTQQLQQDKQAGSRSAMTTLEDYDEQTLVILRLQAANDEHVQRIHELQDTNSEHLSTIDDLQAANAAYAASAQEMKKELSYLREHVTNLESENREHKEINSELETRLASTERKVYALTKERDVLKKGGSKLADINLLVKEKDEIIKSVMEEGEKLSKKCGDLEEKVRNLRGQLKDSETQIAILNSRVSEEENKVASLTKAKAQLEREMVMTQQNAKTDLEQLRLTYDERLRQQSHAQAEAESKAKDSLVEKYQRMAKDADGRADALSDTVLELKEALERQREAAHLREELLQQDLANLEHRCQVAESRHQELTSKMPDATRPLLRQIEAMQAASSAQLQAWAAAENMLEQRIMDAEAAAAAATEREALAQERLQVLQSKLSSSDAALAVARSDIRRLYSELDASSAAREQASKETELKLEEVRQRLSDVQTQLQQAELKAQAQLRVEKEARLVLENDAEVWRKELEDVRAKLEAKQKEASTSGSSKAGTDGGGAGGPPAMAAHGYKWTLVKEGTTPPASLTPNTALNSESSSGSRGVGNSGSGGLMGPDTPSSSRGVSSMEVESLQAELRQKRGDVVFLQHQMEEMKTERTRLSEELVQAAQQCEEALKWQRQVQQLQAELQALQVKYSAAVEMLGEKDERLEELMADLQDVKQLYRDQIEFMCVQLVTAQSAANTPSSSLGDARAFGTILEEQ